MFEYHLLFFFHLIVMHNFLLIHHIKSRCNRLRFETKSGNVYARCCISAVFGNLFAGQLDAPRGPLCVCKDKLSAADDCCVATPSLLFVLVAQAREPSLLSSGSLPTTNCPLWLITEHKQPKTKTSLGVTWWLGIRCYLCTEKASTLLKRRVTLFFIFPLSFVVQWWSMCGNGFGGLWEEAAKRIPVMYVRKVRWRVCQL